MIAHREPLSEHEIGFTAEYCNAFAQSHWLHTHRRFENVDVETQEVVEALSDQNFQTAYQVQYIFHLGLWRMVAVFDAILAQWFPQFASKRLRQRLSAVLRGISVGDDDIRDLHEWINLRNSLSHAPVDAPSFEHQVTEADLHELAELLQRVLAALRPNADPNGVVS